jgi:hypothetical protein
MRSVRSTLLLMTVVIALLGGCALRLSHSLPPSFDAMLRGESVSFTVAVPPSGVLDPA